MFDIVNRDDITCHVGPSLVPLGHVLFYVPLIRQPASTYFLFLYRRSLTSAAYWKPQIQELHACRWVNFDNLIFTRQPWCCHHAYTRLSSKYASLILKLIRTAVIFTNTKTYRQMVNGQGRYSRDDGARVHIHSLIVIPWMVNDIKSSVMIICWLLTLSSNG